MQGGYASTFDLMLEHELTNLRYIGGNDPMEVGPTEKLTTIWAQVKTNEI